MMKKVIIMKKLGIVTLGIATLLFLTACGNKIVNFQNNSEVSNPVERFESVEGRQIRMITDNSDITITLNDSKAAADLVEMLPLELSLIERNNFAKGMTLPEHLSGTEPTTRQYQIGDFGYWHAGPDLAIFYDDIYEKTIVDVIPLGHAETGAETLSGETGVVRLELIDEPA